MCKKYLHWGPKSVNACIGLFRSLGKAPESSAERLSSVKGDNVGGDLSKCTLEFGTKRRTHAGYASRIFPRH